MTKLSSLLILMMVFIGIAVPMETQAAGLRLFWTDNSDNEAGFKIERLSNGVFVEIGTVGTNVTSYADSNSKKDRVYCYQVRAFNSAGISAPSNQACATVSDSTLFSAETTVVLTQSGTTTGSTSTSGSTSASSNNLSSPLGPWADYRETLKIKSTDDNAIGVMFRYVDNRNYYRFLWNTQERFRRLEKLENGVLTVLAQDAVPYLSGQTYQLEILAHGTLLEVRIDDALIFSVADSTFNRGTTALYSSYNQGSAFDDILVEDLATGTVLLWDDFNDGNSTGWTIIDEQGTTQGPSSWSAQSGALVQGSNIGSDTPRNLGTFALYTARAWTDYHFALKVRSKDNGTVGVMFRYRDGNNYYRFSWDQYLKSRVLEKLENGVPRVLAADSTPYVTGQTYSLEIVAQGKALEVRIDGRLIFSVTDTSFDRGSVALYSWYNQGSIFDTILVQDLATGAVLLSDDFSDGNFNGWTIVDRKGTNFTPSVWSALSGALVQSGNIGSDAADRPGTFALY